MKTLKLIFCVIFSIMNLAMAQNEPPEQQEQEQQMDDEKGRQGFWEANLDGGNYVVALNQITSVSKHSYVLDGAVIVDEVTIDTIGQALVRFYFIKPLEAGGTGGAVVDAGKKLVDLADNAVRRTGVDVQDMVVKKYPLTTHSKTIEYRLMTQQQLDSLYGSVKTAWQNGRGRVFTAR
jgi:hypothetical protein